MDFYDVIKQRRSIRNFQATPIPDEAVARIAAAVNAAPSACNIQPVSFKLVRNGALKKALELSWKRGDGFNSAETDAAIAMEHAILAATAEGLGSCWICAFDPVKAAEVLQIPAPCRVAALCPLGYPAAPPREFVRKEESQIFEVSD